MLSLQDSLREFIAFFLDFVLWYWTAVSIKPQIILTFQYGPYFWHFRVFCSMAYYSFPWLLPSFLKLLRTPEKIDSVFVHIQLHQCLVHPRHTPQKTHFHFFLLFLFFFFLAEKPLPRITIPSCV